MSNFKRRSKLTNLSFNRLFLSTLMITLSLSVTIVVDGLFVGNFVGSEQFVALNMIYPLVTFVVMVYVLIGFGGSTYLSVLKGRLDTENSDKLFTISILTLSIIGVIITILSYVFKSELVGLLCVEDVLHGYIIEYLNVYCAQFPLLLVFGGLAYFCRVDNSPIIAAASVIIANIINIVLDYVLICLFNFGIAGAAWASFTGYLVGFGVFLLYFKSKHRTLHFTKSGLSFKSFKLLKDSIKYSGPSAFNEGVVIVSLLAINNLVINFVGVDGMIVFSVFNQASMIHMLFPFGVSETMSPVVGVAIGERDNRAIGFTLLHSLKILIVSTIASIIVFEIFPTEILMLFGVKDLHILQMGKDVIRILAISLLPAILPYFMIYYYQLLNRNITSMLVVIVMNLVTWIPLTWLLGAYLNNNAIWWSKTISEVVTIFFILAITYIVIKRSNRRYRGLFLLDKNIDSNTFDMTLVKNYTSAIENNLPNINEFLQQRGYKQTACKGVCDLLLNEVAHCNNKGEIDVILSINDNNLTIRLRDNFKNSKTIQQSNEINGIEMIKYNYQEVLNLNVTTYIVKQI